MWCLCFTQTQKACTKNSLAQKAIKKLLLFSIHFSFQLSSTLHVYCLVFIQFVLVFQIGSLSVARSAWSLKQFLRNAAIVAASFYYSVAIAKGSVLICFYSGDGDYCTPLVLAPLDTLVSVPPRLLLQLATSCIYNNGIFSTHFFKIIIYNSAVISQSLDPEQLFSWSWYQGLM